MGCKIAGDRMRASELCDLHAACALTWPLSGKVAVVADIAARLLMTQTGRRAGRASR
jgi:hypothetical protein